MANCRLNVIYKAMKQRCDNPKNRDYKDYGGRGIKVCNEWTNPEFAKGIIGCNTKGWLTFKEWALSNGYQDGLTIDRIDVNKGYCPSNCRWVSTKVQHNNTRRNIYITYKGKTQTLAQWCEELDISYNRTYKRIYEHGWNPKKAFEIEELRHERIITYKEKTQNLKDWCLELKINYLKTYRRIFLLNWDVNRAFETK